MCPRPFWHDASSRNRFSSTGIWAACFFLSIRRSCWLTFAALRIASFPAIHSWEPVVRFQSGSAKANLRGSDPFKLPSSRGFRNAALRPPESQRSARSRRSGVLRRLDEQVVVVSHQHRGVDFPSGHRAGLGASGGKESSVVVMKNRFPPVVARHHAWPSEALREGGW